MTQNLWRDIQAISMSGRDGNPKISLSMLKGRSSNQSVPSISFRFDPSAEHVTQVSDQEEEEEDLSSEVSQGTNATNTLETSAAGAIPRAESLRDTSPVKEYLSRSFGKRSSSLDSNSAPLGGESGPTPPQKTNESGSLLSRLTKTFEDKFNEIRKDKDGKVEKEKEKDRLGLSADGSTESDGAGSVGSDRSPSKDKKPVADMVQKMMDEEKSLKVEVTGSPSKTKTTIVQDITEHTSKLKSELGSIRPKLSELRRRSSSKDNSKSGKDATKNKPPSVFTSLLGRDEGLGEEMLLECDEAEVDRAVEAQEDAYVFHEDLSLNEDEAGATALDRNKDYVDFSKSTTPKSSPKRKVPHAMIPAPPKDPTLREQFLELVSKLPVSMSFLSKFLPSVFILAFILPIPSFLSGLLAGVLLSGLVFYCLLHFLLPPPPEDIFVDVGPVLLTLPTYEDKQLYKGWMNELEGEYSPESYHVSATHSVYVRLQGSKLTVDHARGKVPKHARFKEEIRNTSFANQREYNIAGCQVMLLPRNLPRRWLWSRKYPICIRLQVGSKNSSPSPVSIASTPTRCSPQHFPNPPIDLGRQGSSESGEGNWSLDNNKSSGEDDLMTSSLDMGSFEQVTQDMCQETSLILFARSDREKDDWFRRLVAASETYAPKPQSSPSHKPLSTASLDSGGDIILMEGIPEEHPQDQPSTPPEMNFERYMARLLFQPGMGSVPADHKSSGGSGVGGGDGTPTPANVAWVNALAGRLFYDFLRNPYWANKVQERVQRKLSKLHVPYFVGEVVVCGINMGSATPKLIAVGSPKVDARGLWVDLQVEYSGNFTMSLETKLDLMKLKRTTGLETTSAQSISTPPSPGEPATSLGPKAYSRSPSSDGLLRNLHFDTDTDDSVESSSEEEREEDGGLAAEAGLPVGGSGPTSRKLLKLVDTVAASRYFQQAAEWKLLQRALVGVSNTRIELSVEVRRLAGTLALNVPPPPADRLWYGFRGTPELVMVARPRLGDRMLNLPFLVEFIQKQLRVIFEKVFVLPNMDDLVIPIMSPLLPGQKQEQKLPWEACSAGAQGSSSNIEAIISHLTPSKPVSFTSPSVLTPIVKFTPSPH